MQYQKVWEKILKDGEIVRYEFSISDRYRKLCMTGGMIIGAIIMLTVFKTLYTYAIIGLFIFLASLFYFGYYLKTANAYAFTNKRVLIYRGWLTTQTISIDYNKITDVSVIEPILDRVVTKSGYLTINTAGTSQHEVMLKHIAFPYEVKKKLDEIRG